MASSIKPGSSIRRLVKILGLTEPVEVEIAAEGVSFRVKGARKRVTATWQQIAKSANTPLDVPSYLAGRPIEFLQSQISKRSA